MGAEIGINAWILDIEGTQSAPIVASCLAILAAILHAIFAALQKGRHDPCVGIRAVPVGEAMVACIILDHFLLHRGQVGKTSGKIG